MGCISCGDDNFIPAQIALTVLTHPFLKPKQRKCNIYAIMKSFSETERILNDKTCHFLSKKHIFIILLRASKTFLQSACVLETRT